MVTKARALPRPIPPCTTNACGDADGAPYWGTAKNLVLGSAVYTHGVTCLSCHDIKLRIAPVEYEADDVEFAFNLRGFSVEFRDEVGKSLRNCGVLDRFHIYEHLSVLSASSYETRWL